MTNASQLPTCPQCQTPLPADAPQGLCPACLLAAVVEPTEAGPAQFPKAPPPTREQVAAAFPQLEILELIGAGGMGHVFKARQPKLDRLVALKLLPRHLGADAAFAARFEREGRLLARLSHPNIVTVHDFGFASLPISHSPDAIPSSGFYYLLMEFVDGVNLRQAMRAGRFTPVQALEVVPKICEALQFAHEQGILHRDIKPENILLDTRGRVKLVDFGIAKLIGTDPVNRDSVEPPPTVGRDSVEPSNELGAAIISGDATPSQESRFARASSVGKWGSTEPHPTSHATPPETPDPIPHPRPGPALTSATAALGTPSYMAPEQRDRPAEVDHRADIYSLGVVFYEMLTGELPVGKFAPPSAKSASDPRVDQVVLRALEQQRERRQQSAGEIRTQVENIAATPGSNRREVPTPRPLPADQAIEPPAPLGIFRRSLGWGIFLGALAVLALVIGLTMLFGGTALSEWLKNSPLFTSRKSASEAVSPVDAPTVTVAETPPVIVRTQPMSGAREVEPTVVEVRATFSKEMRAGSWSWVEAWPGSTPEVLGEPHFTPDSRTGVVRVRLEPARTYGWWLNSEEFQNFADRDGRPAVPYLLVFQTKSVKTTK